MADDDNDTLDEDSVRDYLSSRGLDPAPGAIVRTSRGRSVQRRARHRQGRRFDRGQAGATASACRRRVVCSPGASAGRGRRTRLGPPPDTRCHPRVLDRDADRCALVVERAPAGWQDWKSLLLSGRIDPRVAKRLGSLLSTWHNATRFRLSSPFLPTFTTGGSRSRRYESTPITERSPGAYLTRPDLCSAMWMRCWHAGSVWFTAISRQRMSWSAPAHTCGLSTSKLLIWVIQPSTWPFSFPICSSSRCTDQSWHPSTTVVRSSFSRRLTTGTARAELSPSWEYVLGHVGCLLLARVDGKSPAEYLTAGDRSARLASS